MKRYILAGIVLIITIAVVIALLPEKPEHKANDNTNDSYEYYYNENEEEEDSLLPEDLSSILTDNQTVPLDTIPGSLTVLVNRNYLLPATYTPAHLVVPNVKFSFTYLSDKRKMRKVAAEALEKLFAAGKKAGVELYGVSGYRSYARQKEIYDRNIATRGQEATDAVSAKPGSSEHQTGLTIDVSAKSVNYRLDQSFGDTKEGKWLAKNAHLYGYVIRYPYGKSKITGYSYEPWHIRFLGVTVATYLYENNLTLEEYYGVEASADEPENAVDVEDPDSVKYATPKPTTRPKATRKPSETQKPKKTNKPKATKKPSKKPGTGNSKTPAKTAPPAPVPAQTQAPAVQTPAPATEPPAPTPAPTEPPARGNDQTTDNTGASQEGKE